MRVILTSRITSYAAGGFELLENAPGDFVCYCEVINGNP
jgi:hypothetical protein